MIKLEEVRQTLVSTIQSVHAANYPTILVNYPNNLVVDIEHQELPFVSVELSFDDTPRAALGEKEILVTGAARLIYYHREGKGFQGAFSYTDMLNEHLALQLTDSIQYDACQVITIKTFPGWVGEMNSIRFNVVQGLGC